MKKIKNLILTDLHGKDLAGPLYSKNVYEPHFNNASISGPESLKVFSLGMKIAKLDEDVPDIILEDAEFELLKKICDPKDKMYGALVYGQLEKIFSEAEDYEVNK